MQKQQADDLDPSDQLLAEKLSSSSRAYGIVYIFILNILFS